MHCLVVAMSRPWLGLYRELSRRNSSRRGFGVVVGDAEPSGVPVMVPLLVLVLVVLLQVQVLVVSGVVAAVGRLVAVAELVALILGGRR